MYQQQQQQARSSSTATLAVERSNQSKLKRCREQSSSSTSKLCLLKQKFPLLHFSTDDHLSPCPSQSLKNSIDASAHQPRPALFSILLSWFIPVGLHQTPSSPFLLACADQQRAETGNRCLNKTSSLGHQQEQQQHRVALISSSCPQPTLSRSAKTRIPKGSVRQDGSDSF